MKAVAYITPGPIDREDALQDAILETPKAEGRDLLVKGISVSVNPRVRNASIHLTGMTALS